MHEDRAALRSLFFKGYQARLVFGYALPFHACCVQAFIILPEFFIPPIVLFFCHRRCPVPFQSTMSIATYQKRRQTGIAKYNIAGIVFWTVSGTVLLPVMYLIFTFFFVFDALAINPAAQAYTQKYKAVVVSKSVEYSIPYTVLLGIAIVESGSGQSRNARELNNHFGIVGKNSLKRKTRYRQYEDVKESYDHFCRVLSKKPFYSNLKSTKNHEPWIRVLSRAGYSEMPSVWKKRVLGVIEDIYIL